MKGQDRLNLPVSEIGNDQSAFCQPYLRRWRKCMFFNCQRVLVPHSSIEMNEASRG